MKKLLWAVIGAAVVSVVLFFTRSDITPSEPTVVFTPGGQFSESDRAQLTERLANPFFDFQDEQGQTFLTMNIERSIEGAYTFTAIAASGVTYQAVINRQGGDFAWWVPDCLDGCQFSDSFAEKYPEIVSQSRGR